MYVKQSFFPAEYVCSDAPFAFTRTNRLKGRCADQFKSGYGYLQEVIANQWRLPDCPQHQNDVVPFQVLKYTLHENLCGPRFPFGSTELRDRDSVGVGTGPLSVFSESRLFSTRRS